MVVTAPAVPRTRAGQPAVVVPDPAAWALWGEDLAARGIVPAASPAGASLLVVPAVVPDGLAEAVRAAWAEMPAPRRLMKLDGPALPGTAADELIGEEPAGDRHGHEHQHGHEHDHGDMMEITGEPSRDGLVMESIELEHGPLAPGLPGGLVVQAELDGDMVASCAVRASLSASGPGGGSLTTRVPDPLAPVAWSLALRRAAGDSPPGAAAIAALELERALSHLGWLGGFATVLGWGELGARARAAAAPLIASAGSLERFAPGAQPEPEPEPAAVAEAVDASSRRASRLLALLEPSRGLRARARGRAVVTREEASEAGLSGPNARASGLRDDARTDDPAYRSLGFEPRGRDAGDVEARVLQRALEARDALELAARALERRAELDGIAVAEREGPRGPVRAGPPSPEAPPALSAPGSAAARGLAAERATGLEWASALTAIASFDLSPWEVAG